MYISNMSLTPFGYYGSAGGGGPGPRGPRGVGISSANLVDNNDGTTTISFDMSDNTTLGPFPSSLVSDVLNCTSVDTSSFIKTPVLKVGATTYTLPEDGTIGQVLSTNGTGTLDWVPNSSTDLQTAYDNLLPTTVLDVSAGNGLEITGTNQATDDLRLTTNLLVNPPTLGDAIFNVQAQGTDIFTISSQNSLLGNARTTIIDTGVIITGVNNGLIVSDILFNPPIFQVINPFKKVVINGDVRITDLSGALIEFDTGSLNANAKINVTSTQPGALRVGSSLNVNTLVPAVEMSNSLVIKNGTVPKVTIDTVTSTSSFDMTHFTITSATQSDDSFKVSNGGTDVFQIDTNASIITSRSDQTVIQPINNHPFTFSVEDQTAARSFVVNTTANRIYSETNPDLGTLPYPFNRIYANLDLSDNVVDQMSTGVVTGGVLSYLGNTFSVSAGTGWLASAGVSPISWSNISNITPTYLNTHTKTYISINAVGSVIQSNIKPTGDLNRTFYIYLGIVHHGDLTNIDSAYSEAAYVKYPTNSIQDLYDAIGTISSGNQITSNGANLNIDKAIGTLSSYGINYPNPNTHIKEYVASTTPSFTYIKRDVVVSSGNTINPNQYDLNGVLTTVDNNKITVQRVYLCKTGMLKIQYGQVVHATMEIALSLIPEKNYVPNDDISGCCMLCYIAVKQGTADLSNPLECQFIQASKFGGVGGSGDSTVISGLQTQIDNIINNPQDIQSVYDQSTTKRITLDSSLGLTLFEQNTPKFVVENDTQVFAEFASTGNRIAGMVPVGVTDNIGALGNKYQNIYGDLVNTSTIQASGTAVDIHGTTRLHSSNGSNFADGDTALSFDFTGEDWAFKNSTEYLRLGSTNDNSRFQIGSNSPLGAICSFNCNITDTGQITFFNSNIRPWTAYANYDMGASDNRWNKAWFKLSPDVTSDESTKENISDCTLGLSFLTNITPKKYDVIGHTETNNRKIYGIVAQDVQAALDVCGCTDFGGLKVNDIPATETKPARQEYSIDPFAYVAVLINAVKDLKTLSDSQAATIATQTTQIANMASDIAALQAYHP